MLGVSTTWSGSSLLILAIPIFDTAYVAILRILRGRSPFRGSPDHFAIRLRAAGLPVPGVVVVTYAAGTALGALSLWNLFLTRAQSLLLVGGALLTMVLSGLALARVRVDRDG